MSYLRKLYVTVDGITVTMMKARRTLVSMGNIDPHPTTTTTTTPTHTHTHTSCITLALFLILWFSEITAKALFYSHFFLNLILIPQLLSLFNAIILETCLLSSSSLFPLLICLICTQIKKVGLMCTRIEQVLSVHGDIVILSPKVRQRDA